MALNWGKIMLLLALGIHFTLPLLRDIVPNYQQYQVEDWLAFVGIYCLAIISALPLMYGIKSFGTSFSRFELSQFIPASILITLQVVVATVFWSNPVLMYLLVAVIVTVTGALISYLSRGTCGVRNQDPANWNQSSPNQHLTKSGSPFLMSSEFTLSDHSRNDSNPDVSNSYSPGDIQSVSLSDNVLNPSSGSPMIGGMSGLDMNGNSWGTNFNEPNNTYDPNRGY